MIAAVALGGSVVLGRWRLAIAAGVVLVVIVAPILAVVSLLGLASLVTLRAAVRPRATDDDDVLLAELAALGLTAGLTFPAAVEAATTAVPGEASDRLRRAERTAGGGGEGPETDPGLFRVARRARSTGASLLPAISGYAAALRDEERSVRLVAARRLPVTLLFPLALLILPGFLILTIGPTLLGSLERLGL